MVGEQRGEIYEQHPVLESLLGRKRGSSYRVRQEGSLGARSVAGLEPKAFLALGFIDACVIVMRREGVDA